MIERIEYDFVRKFIKKEKQDRLFYELGSKNKRVVAVSKFAHNANEYIKPNLIVLSGKHIFIEDIKKIVLKLSPENTLCHLIGTALDGSAIEFLKGLEYCFNEFQSSILKMGNYVFIKEETEMGTPMKYLLIDNKQQ